MRENVLLLQAHQLLEREMQVVKEGMGHKELTLEEYGSIWEECYREVLYVPSQNRYTRASMASNKDRLESMERQLQTNRQLMTRQAKKAAKLEKKLKILTGGYQVHVCTVMQQTQVASLTLRALAATPPRGVCISWCMTVLTSAIS